MAISFACVCGKQLKVGDQFAGKRARCPACAGVVIVPMPAVEPPATEDAAFDVLSQGPDPEPAPRVLKPSARQWEEEDRTPYGVNSPVVEAPPARQSTRTIPKFKAQKMQRREERRSERRGISVSPGVIASIVGIVIFGGLNLLTLANGWISIWLVILFGGSVINLIRGLLGLSED